MAAAASVRYYHGTPSGTPGGNVIGTTIRYKRADNEVQDTANPLPKPDAGESLSWSKNSKIFWGTTPSGVISNLRYFVSSVPTNIKHYSKVFQYGEASATDENGITGFTDTQPNKDANDETQRTSSSPLVVNASTVLSNPNTGEGVQDFVRSQLGVKSAYAGPSPIAAFNIVYRYSET